MKTMVKKKNSFIVTDIKHIKDNNINENKKKLKTKSKKQLNESKNVSKSEINSSKKQELNSNLGTNNGNNIQMNNRIKTNRFRDNCFENRKQKGLVLLSSKVEKKIYNLKKGLRNKGMNEMEIKTIVRKRRREEENKYYRLSNQKCFKCRQMGHKLVDCPLSSNDCEEGVDVCYRCGSTEHKLSECNQKSNALPFAKCFLCSQTGHLTRDCSQNTRGVYPKGGSCKACHSVNHLIKDCPQNLKDKELENELTLSTFDANHSIDADVMDMNSIVVKKDKPKKIIKF